MDKLNLMQTFVHVVEQGSFTAAATRLGKTKALVSTQIGQLESWLNVRLIERSTRQLRITEAGQQCYQRAKALLEDVAELETQAHNTTGALSGRLRITLPRGLGESVILPILAKHLPGQPALNLDIHLADHYVDLLEGGFDAGIRVGHLKDSLLIGRELGNMPVLVAASHTWLEQNGTPSAPNALQDLPCVLDSNLQTGTRWSFVIDGNPQWVRISPVAEVNSAQSAAELAAAGMGAVYGPAFALAPLIGTGKLTPILTGFMPPPVPVHLLYAQRKWRSAKISWLFDILREDMTLKWD